MIRLQIWLHCAYHLVLNIKLFLTHLCQQSNPKAGFVAILWFDDDDFVSLSLRVQSLLYLRELAFWSGRWTGLSPDSGARCRCACHWLAPVEGRVRALVLVSVLLWWAWGVLVGDFLEKKALALDLGNGVDRQEREQFQQESDSWGMSFARCGSSERSRKAHIWKEMGLERWGSSRQCKTCQCNNGNTQCTVTVPCFKCCVIVMALFCGITRFVNEDTRQLGV